jgi:hypothetical protein
MRQIANLARWGATRHACSELVIGDDLERVAGGPNILTTRRATSRRAELVASRCRVSPLRAGFPEKDAPPQR